MKLRFSPRPTEDLIEIAGPLTMRPITATLSASTPGQRLGRA